MRVVLAGQAPVELHKALGTAATAFPAIARKLALASPEPADDPLVEATLAWQPVASRPIPATAKPQHHLVILRPKSAVRRIALYPGSITIGRAPPSTLLLEGAEVSRTHCRIDVAGDTVTVTDLNSTNGTLVDNQRMSGTTPLLHGALLQIGNYVLSCEYQSAAQSEDAERTHRRSTFGEVTVLRPRRSRSP